MPLSRRWSPSWLIATCFGVGYLQPGPGTYGSLVAALLWLLAGWFLHHNTLELTIGAVIGSATLTLAGVAAASKVARESSKEDPAFVVIDEVVGQWIALLFLPPMWPNALVAFLMFRFFDILKPWPIRRLEALPAGVGIMADDIAAGCFALGATQLVLRFFLRLQ